jgi:hypothetical protein
MGLGVLVSGNFLFAFAHLRAGPGLRGRRFFSLYLFSFHELGFCWLSDYKEGKDSSGEREESRRGVNGINWVERGK